MNKIVSLKEAVSKIENGSSIGIGGNVLHRAPMSLIREIIRQDIKSLKIIKTAGAHDVDILCSKGLVESVDAGFISYETKFGLAQHYRKGVQEGIIKGNEHACYTVISALRAGAYGIPFMPVKGLKYGDLLKVNDYFKVVEDPFEKEPITIVKALIPDVSIIHVHECDEEGNAIIHGPKFDDVLLSRASKRVIITTENIVSSNRIRMNNIQVDIPGMLVEAVILVNGGAKPCSCYKKYDVDKKGIETFVKCKEDIEIDKYIKNYEKMDRGNKGGYTW